jgi:hypothetical protein
VLFHLAALDVGHDSSHELDQFALLLCRKPGNRACVAPCQDRRRLPDYCVATISQFQHRGATVGFMPALCDEAVASKKIDGRHHGGLRNGRMQEQVTLQHRLTTARHDDQRAELSRAHAEGSKFRIQHARENPVCAMQDEAQRRNRLRFARGFDDSLTH